MGKVVAASAHLCARELLLLTHLPTACVFDSHIDAFAQQPLVRSTIEQLRRALHDNALATWEAPDPAALADALQRVSIEEPPGADSDGNETVMYGDDSASATARAHRAQHLQGWASDGDDTATVASSSRSRSRVSAHGSRRHRGRRKRDTEAQGMGHGPLKRARAAAVVLPQNTLRAAAAGYFPATTLSATTDALGSHSFAAALAMRETTHQQHQRAVSAAFAAPAADATAQHMLSGPATHRKPRRRGSKTHRPQPSARRSLTKPK